MNKIKIDMPKVAEKKPNEIELSKISIKTVPESISREEAAEKTGMTVNRIDQLIGDCTLNFVKPYPTGARRVAVDENFAKFLKRLALQRELKNL